MRRSSFQALNPQGLHRVVYHEWGSQQNQRVLICVHGLARNSRDFDALAQALSRDYRVICPDIVGRGQSDWLPEGAPYEIGQYLNDMVALLARLDVEQVDWLGTSMGGMIGMLLAAYPSSPIKRLILNDIGPWVDHQALQRISQYVGRAPLFASIDEAEAYLRQLYPAFEGIDADQWHHLARQGVRQVEEERWAVHYDPRIGDYTRASADQDIDLWPVWQQLSCPQLLVWGEDSDILSRQTVERMRQLNPDLELSSWPGVGHAPALMQAEQIRIVVDWLRH